MAFSQKVAQPPPPQLNVVGSYRLCKTLGIGSFSKVKLAIHESTGEKVAIKILNRKKLKHMDMAAKTNREINILRLFMHPHIIRLYEVIHQPSDIFVVMEYVPGGELFDYIVSKGRLPEDEGRLLFQQIIAAVEYCHTHMVVHRDLKPENILLGTDNSVKLADFGLSNMMRDGQFLKTSCGSPNYAAPEVISGNLYAGPEVDVWSCGVILYALLCGSLPFDDDIIPNLFRKIKGGIYTLPSFISPEVRDLIPRMLVVDPMKRISVHNIRKHPWFQNKLPLYLQPCAHLDFQNVHSIDQDCVENVTKMIGCSKSDVLQALSLGPDLLTKSEYSQHMHLTMLAVSYHLLLDRRRKVLQIEQSHILKSPHISPLHSPIHMGCSPPEFSLDSPPKVPNDPPSFAENHKLMPPFSPNTDACKPARRWYVGIWSLEQPRIVMNELYRSLKVLNFDWKILSPYKLKVRYPANPDINKQAKIVKIGIQLYKTPRNRLVLDVQKLHGEMFPFLDLCALLIAELRI